MNRFRAIVQITLLTVLATAAVAGFAQDGSDPPGRVARLSALEGSVSLQPAGVEDWAAAVVNRPLTTGDKLWVDANSRAELEVGGIVIHLGSGTGFSFLNLDDNTAQMRITAGTVIVRVRRLLENQTDEIDTPNLAVTLERPGDYRVEVNDAGDTSVVKVSQGEALAAGGGQSTAVHNQESVTFTGTDQVQADVATLGAPDDLDEWAFSRGRRAQESESRRYVAEDVAGTEDLDENGDWRYTPDYGYVWAPRVVAAGWAPYHYGHWVWITPWGWTWVDDEPWGFAPFHYGRWAFWGASWVWVPGPRYLHPVYAPALVAWAGGIGVGVGIGIGGPVGWFPLGPREVYVPGYHVSETYVRNVNVSNTTIVNNTYITNVYNNRVTNITYVNSKVPGAVTAVEPRTFTSGQTVANHIVPLSATSRMTTSAAPPAIVPRRESVLGPGSNRAVARPPGEFLNRPVVARTPPPAESPSFEKQLAAVKANGGRPVSRGQLVQLQPRALASPVRLVQPSGQPDNRSLADREHALQQRTVPSVPAARPAPSGIAPAPAAGPSRGPPERTIPERTAPKRPTPGSQDRPPWAQAPSANPPSTRSAEEARRPAELQRAPQTPRPQSGGYAPPPREYSSPRESPPAREYAPPPREYSSPRESPPAREYAPPPRESAPPPRATYSPPRDRPPEAPRAVEEPRRSAPPPPPAMREVPRSAPPAREAPHSERNTEQPEHR